MGWLPAQRGSGPFALKKAAMFSLSVQWVAQGGVMRLSPSLVPPGEVVTPSPQGGGCFWHLPGRVSSGIRFLPG